MTNVSKCERFVTDVFAHKNLLFKCPLVKHPLKSALPGAQSIMCLIRNVGSRVINYLIIVGPQRVACGYAVAAATNFGGKIQGQVRLQQWFALVVMYQRQLQLLHLLHPGTMFNTQGHKPFYTTFNDFLFFLIFFFELFLIIYDLNFKALAERV